MGNKMNAKAIRKKRAEQKAKIIKSVATITSIVIGLAVIGCIAWVIIYSLSFSVKETSDFSVGLNADGTITGVKATDYVELCDYNNISVDYSAVSVTDGEVDDYIDSLLSEYKTYSTDPDCLIKKNDSINIDYVGSIDGVEFSGGSTQGNGTDIVVGQAGYIDDFEDQLIGHKAGDVFDIEVTFPDDYGNEEVAGKDAVFNITINGIYEAQEFNDEFVKANLSDQARTAEAFRQKYKDDQYNAKLSEYLQNYVCENSEVKSYPESYVKGLMGLTKGSDLQNYNQYNQYYQSAYGTNMYNSFEEYINMDKKEYYASLRAGAEELADKMLVYQAIYEKEGLTISEQNKEDVLASYGISSEYHNQIKETYGEGFLNQSAIMFADLDYLKEHVTVNGKPE